MTTTATTHDFLALYNRFSDQPRHAQAKAELVIELEHVIVVREGAYDNSRRTVLARKSALAGRAEDPSIGRHDFVHPDLRIHMTTLHSSQGWGDIKGRWSKKLVAQLTAHVVEINANYETTQAEKVAEYHDYMNEKAARQVKLQAAVERAAKAVEPLATERYPLRGSAYGLKGQAVRPEHTLKVGNYDRRVQFSVGTNYKTDEVQINLDGIDVKLTEDQFARVMAILAETPAQ